MLTSLIYQEVLQIPALNTILYKKESSLLIVTLHFKDLKLESLNHKKGLKVKKKKNK